MWEGCAEARYRSGCLLPSGGCVDRAAGKRCRSVRLICSVLGFPGGAGLHEADGLVVCVHIHVGDPGMERMVWLPDLFRTGGFVQAG